MAAHDPTVRKLAAAKAVLTSWAYTEDRSARTAPARAAHLKSFEDKVDPERKLSPEERAKRADALRRAWYADLALKSARARAAKKATTAEDAA